MTIDAHDLIQRLQSNIRRVVLGKEDVVRLAVVALLAGEHVLLEDVPGVGKTLLGKALARSLAGEFRRIQFTPDLLPGDITGSSLYNSHTQEFVFSPGPIFANVVLADEINRATPRTQAALLECMGERQITVDGVTRPLNRPFIVLATQNPVEYEGTFPLPEAELDRFLLKLKLGYLDAKTESRMLVNLRQQHPIETLTPVVDGADTPDFSRQIWDVHVDDTVRDYIVRLVNATRTQPDLLLGASPRGSLALYKASQAWAILHGRDYVLPDDVKRLAPLTLAHRCLVHPESALRGRTAGKLIADLLSQVPLDLGKVG